MRAVIWSKRSCTFCEQAKSLLKSRGIEYEERKIGDGWTKEELLEAVPTAQTVPQIFLEEEYIGGFQQLQLKLMDK
jgi:glutaredoxin